MLRSRGAGRYLRLGEEPGRGGDLCVVLCSPRRLDCPRDAGVGSAGNCRPLGKLCCLVSHCAGVCVWAVDSPSEFTNVYRAAQQGNGRAWGGGKVDNQEEHRNE